MHRAWLGLFLVGLIISPAFGQQGTTTRVSVSSTGGQGNQESSRPSMSADSRHVAFRSGASNLVLGDTNGVFDVFVHDQQTGQTTRVSVATGGGQVDSFSEHASISGDGRFVAFDCSAYNLVPEDTNGTKDVFVHDRQTGQTTRVSFTTSGGEAQYHCYNPSISADGRHVAFDGASQVFVHDRQTGRTTRVSVSTGGGQGNSVSQYASISADGRFVAFQSNASNLVPGDTNGTTDVFVHDRQTGQTTRVSVATVGGQGSGVSEDPSISADGRFVAFESNASNLVLADTNGAYDVFVHDRQTGETFRVSVSTGGGQASDPSYSPSISTEGRYVAFDSWASNLVLGDTYSGSDAFMHDRQTGQTTLLSVATGGEQGSQGGGATSISADGRFVAFHSFSPNLVLGDSNGYHDVFVHQYGPNMVSGMIHFSDLSPSASPPPSCIIDFEVVPGNIVVSRPATLDAAGNFEVVGPDVPGLYLVSVKHSHWLRRTVGPVDTYANVTGVLVPLLNGDVDEDNEVAIGDYAVLSGAFGSSPGDGHWVANADLNGDESVDIGDFAILSTNFGLVGDE